MYGCQIRPYADVLNIGYAVVIPFNDKKDCLKFCKQYQLNIKDITDDIPPNIPLGLFSKAIDKAGIKPDDLIPLTKKLKKDMKMLP